MALQCSAKDTNESVRSVSINCEARFWFGAGTELYVRFSEGYGVHEWKSGWLPRGQGIH